MSSASSTSINSTSENVEKMNRLKSEYQQLLEKIAELELERDEYT